MSRFRDVFKFKHLIYFTDDVDLWNQTLEMDDLLSAAAAATQCNPKPKPSTPERSTPQRACRLLKHAQQGAAATAGGSTVRPVSAGHTRAQSVGSRQVTRQGL